MANGFTTSTSLTITSAASLSAGSAASSAAVTTGTSNNLAQIAVSINILTTATAPSGNKKIAVYAYASEDGSNYSGASGGIDNVDGTDKALTALGSPSNLYLLGYIYLNQGANVRTIRRSFEILEAVKFIPRKWGIVLYNDAGTTLGATVSATYSEIYY